MTFPADRIIRINAQRRSREEAHVALVAAAFAVSGGMVLARAGSGAKSAEKKAEMKKGDKKPVA